MLQISAHDYFKTHKDYKGIYENFHGDKPEWKGRKTILIGCITKEPNQGLGIEGVHFEIIGTYKPTAHEIYESTRN